MIDPTCTAPDVVDAAGLLPAHRWRVDLPADLIEVDVRLWAMPGIYRHWATPSSPYVPTYLPALAPYLTHPIDLGLRPDPQVRLPEGARGRLAPHTEELWCVRSPLAALPCEGRTLGEHERIPMQHGIELGPGHVWSGEVAGQHCMRCGCRAGLRPLAAEVAPLVAASCRAGNVDCARGDDRTRAILFGNITAYQSGGFGEQVYRTTPAMRHGILERASSPASAGGRWLLPDDVTPDDAPEAERPRWVELAALVRETETAKRSLPAFDQWVAGTACGPRENTWGFMWSEVKPRLAALVAADGPPVYVDARAMLAALRASWPGEDCWGLGHPAENVARELRNMHDKRERQARPSLLLLFPPPDEDRDRKCGLRAARALWAGGR